MPFPFRLARACLALSGALFATPVVAADYIQAPGSSLVFAGKYDGEVFVGTFPDFKTQLSFDPAKPEDARLDVTIPLTSTDSGNDDRDQTLKDTAFFDVARFAKARYTATGFRPLGDDRYMADGMLSLRGIEKPVALTITWTPGKRPTLAGKATVPRLAFGVGAGDWGDTDMLPNEIAVSTKVFFTPVE